MKRIIGPLTSRNARVSAIHYFGSFIVNIGNYFFHLVLLRLLSPQAYGEFLSYISFLYVISIPSQTVNLLVSKHVASFLGKNDSLRINAFFYYLLKKTLLPTLVLALFLVLTSSQLSSLFKADSTAFIILSISLILSLFSSIIRSYLLAFQKFVFNTTLSLLEILIKAGLALIFIKLGLSATGVILAMFLTGVISIFISFSQVKTAIYPRKKFKSSLNINLKKSVFYSLIFSAGSLCLLSVDVLMVRLFFSPLESGVYSAMSVLARMIFYGLAPLTTLMLPFISRRFAANRPTKTVLFKLSAAIIFFGIIGVSIFSFFPVTIVRILSGSAYLSGASLLPLFSLSLLFLALSYVILTYLIAVNKNKATLALLPAFILQPLLIFFFHTNLNQVILINLGIQVFLLTFFLICYYTQAKDVN